MGTLYSTATVDADFNIFGYDPDGRVAHLASHFYGPDWKPNTYGHILRLHGSAQAPRYGYPAPHQALFLPTTFEPVPVPQYYGSPYPPYLTPPKKFDPHIFAALLPQPRTGGHHRRLDPAAARATDVTGLQGLGGDSFSVTLLSDGI